MVSNNLPQIAWPDAVPTWEDLDAEGQDLHREECSDGCNLCENHRAWGECSKCWDDSEAIGPDELSVCCGSKVVLSAPEMDDYREVRAA
jgi:hypothetical protein